jgi:hypothetical protein
MWSVERAFVLHERPLFSAPARECDQKIDRLIINTRIVRRFNRYLGNFVPIRHRFVRLVLEAKSKPAL